jgi:hypothetical protein
MTTQCHISFLDYLVILSVCANKKIITSEVQPPGICLLQIFGEGEPLEIGKKMLYFPSGYLVSSFNY